jgi:hypothetical protein
MYKIAKKWYKNVKKGQFFAKNSLFSPKKRVLLPKIPHCVQKSG